MKNHYDSCTDCRFQFFKFKAYFYRNVTNSYIKWNRLKSFNVTQYVFHYIVVSSGVKLIYPEDIYLLIVFRIEPFDLHDFDK